MNFFCTKEHCNTWLDEAGLSDKNIFPVDIRTGFMIGKYAFSEEQNTQDSI